MNLYAARGVAAEARLKQDGRLRQAMLRVAFVGRSGRRGDPPGRPCGLGINYIHGAPIRKRFIPHVWMAAVRG